MKGRTVITGVGPVSAVGIGIEEFLAGILAGESGVCPLPADDEHAGRLAAAIAEFQIEDYVESSKAYLDRASEFALAATNLAIKDSGIDLSSSESMKKGLVLGSGWGSVGTMTLFYGDVVEKGPRLAKPFLFPHTYSNTAPSVVAIEYGLDGPHLNFSSGMVSSSCAIAAAHDLVVGGTVDLVLAGGYEALTGLIFGAYDEAGCLSAGEDEGCAPFDISRNGFVLGEGGGVLVLEELEHAVARKARIYGEIAGVGLCGDSTVARDAGGAGIADAMNLAMSDAGIDVSALDMVSASANGSVVLDRNEATALRQVLGEKASDIPVGSIKSMTGEAVGASGALQVIAALGSLESGKVPPTVNMTTSDVGAGLCLSGGHAQRERIRTVMVNSIDPGGSIASVVLTGTPE